METKQTAKDYIKKYRLKQRILSMLKQYNNCLFLTFTFKDSILNQTNQETRKRYIKAYLNEMASEYILNIDYGKTNKREHYHAIATPKYKIFLYDRYFKKYGAIKGETIGQLKRFANANKSINELAERLTNHATKETTLNNKIIYSRPNKTTYKESKYKKEIDYRIFEDEEEKERKRFLKNYEKEQAEMLENFFKNLTHNKY